jgi:hypothetical protein
MASNPAPRAALSTRGGPRPALRRRTAVAAPPPEVEGEPVVVEAAAPVVVEAAAPARVGRHKVKHKKGHRAPKDAPAETAEVVVALTKPVRRALKAAAADRDTTPEALAALVLSAWLER